jgi:hypothetical protein
MSQAGSEEILARNWDGKTAIIPLIRDILGREKELLGNQKDKIMEYIGYEQLGSLAKPNNID